MLSCAGQDPASFWNSLVEGKCGIGPITLFDAAGCRTRIAGEVKDFDPCRYMSFKEAKRMDRFCQFAVCAGLMAVQDAGLPENFEDSGIRPERVGVMVSSGIGGMAVFAEQIKVLNDRGPDRVSPLLIPMMIGDIASGNLSMRLQVKGPNFGLVSACSTGKKNIWAMRSPRITVNGSSPWLISPTQISPR